MDKGERKKRLKEHRDFLKELLVKPQEQYPDAECLIRDEIIDNIVFGEIQDTNPDEEIKLGESVTDSFKKNSDKFLTDLERLSDSDKEIAILKYQLCNAENNMIPYEVLLAKQVRFRNMNSEKKELDLIDILNEVKSSLLAASLDYYADSLDLVITQLQIDNTINSIIKCNVGGSKPLADKPEIVNKIKEILAEGNCKTNTQIARAALTRFKKGLPQQESDEVDENNKIGTVRDWVRDEKKNK